MKSSRPVRLATGLGAGLGLAAAVSATAAAHVSIEESEVTAGSSVVAAAAEGDSHDDA